VSYQRGTILKRKNLFKEPKTGAVDMRAYNEVEVIGPSPVQTNVRSAEWGDQGGDNISIKPTTFGEVLDRPERELERDYEVVSTPDEPDLNLTVTRVKPGPSPEDIFRAEDMRPQSEKREETPLV
jgi:hypothetical protein